MESIPEVEEEEEGDSDDLYYPCRFASPPIPWIRTFDAASIVNQRMLRHNPYVGYILHAPPLSMNSSWELVELPQIRMEYSLSRTYYLLGLELSGRTRSNSLY